MQLLAVARKQWRERARADVTYLVLTQPLVFILLWGFCASYELRDVRVAVLDQAGTREGRAVARDLDASRAFKVVERVSSTAALDQVLIRGDANMGVILPPSLGRTGSPREAPVLVVADGSDANIATAGVAQAMATIGESLDRGPPAPQPEIRAWYSPSLRSADVLLPGAIGYNLTWFFFYPAESLIEERRRGTLATLAATPVGVTAMWLGTILPNLVLAIWGSLVQLALMLFLVGVPFRGDPGVLLVGMVLLSLTHLNIGVMVARVVGDTAKLTVYGLLALFPVIVLSGFLIPRAFLPDWTQAVGDAIPLKHGLIFLRAVMLKGTGAPRELAVLAAFTLGTSVLALWATRGLLRRGSMQA